MFKGANTYIRGSNNLDLKKPNYLSLRWFFYGMGDSYNPE